MIYAKDNLFLLHTLHTTYAFAIRDGALCEHLYYGAKLPDPKEGDDMAAALSHKVSHGKGTTVNYTKEGPLTLEDLLLEVSSSGKGDFREPMIGVVYGDGSRTSDFVYDSYEISEGTGEIPGMPCALAGDSDRVSQLTLHLKERSKDAGLDLIYTVFEESDCVTRRAVLYNAGEESLTIERLLSLQLDLPRGKRKMITFGGHWAREMERFDTNLSHGLHVNHTQTGVSSNRNNPFVIVADETVTETSGEAYAFNLVYSGNHYEACEVSGFYTTRFVSGIDPNGFSWTLLKGESFATPEAVMTYSVCGLRGISRSMHAFVRNHIVRGKYRNTPRPVLLNSWEASYFHISESGLLKLAGKAAEAGAELFVMDDGWFRGRNSDRSSLGDWVADEKKLPGGIKRLSKKVHDLGLQFGIWVEPEMISEDSDLYRAHPEYALAVPGRDQSLGRNQMILDLTDPQVVTYVKDAMRSVFTDNGIDYVKWDMNRPFSDVFSPALSPDLQGGVSHRYVLGLYDILQTLTQEYPEILFEGCASGGNRFDLGMLCFFPQIWASDDTDAIMRTKIQTGYRYGYPMSVVSAHVSACPNHQTLRRTPLATRFAVAAFGVLGYEIDPGDLDKGEREEIASQIKLYKEWRDVFFAGDFYRVNEREWMAVAKDRSRAVAMVWNELNRPNEFGASLKTAGLDEEAMYHVYNLPVKYDIREFGNLVNMIAPLHVRQDSMLHNTIAKFVQMDGEVEDLTVSGALLNRAGIVLAQDFGGTGYEGQTRLFQDFASRMYFIERV